MDDALLFTLKLPSLKEIAQIRIARLLWNSKRELFLTISSELAYDRFKNKVKLQIALLPIPRQLKKNLNIYVNFIGAQICNWIFPFFRFPYCSRYPQYPDKILRDYLYKDKLRWTVYGTIDVRETAGLLICDEKMPILNRYQLACEFCFEEDITRLWNKMKPGEFHGKKLKNIKNKDYILVYYWSCKMKGKLRYLNEFSGIDPFRSPEENVFEAVITQPDQYRTYEVPLEYFWRKLKVFEKRRQVERLVVAITHMRNYYRCEGWCYVLSQIEPEEQNRILHDSPFLFLEFFLSHPWQHLFFPAMRLISKDRIVKSLSYFLSIISLDHCDECMREQFFDELRPLFPEYVYNNPETVGNFQNKLQKGQHEYVIQVMEDATDAQKLNFILASYSLCGDVDQLHSLKFLIEAWVAANCWPELKEKIERIFEKWLSTRYVHELQPLINKFLEICDSVDNNFAS